VFCSSRLILVDSTRAGKRIPDALSKTVPIWCAVINRAILLRGGCFVDRFEVPLPSSSSSSSSSDVARVDTDLDLHTPPGAVSPHEHAQIAARLDIWATTLAVSYVPPALLSLCFPHLLFPRVHAQDSSYALPELAKPLRPLWITPASARFPYIAPDASFLPVICVSASHAVDVGTERRIEGFSYVQGSGDDHESWGQVGTPSYFPLAPVDSVVVYYRVIHQPTTGILLPTAILLYLLHCRA
jgi:tRNA A64-2'-O-ribosylphosphate transferase